MSMLEKFKAFFTKTKKPEPEEITLKSEEIPAWLKSEKEKIHSSLKNIEESFQEKLNLYLFSLEESNNVLLEKNLEGVKEIEKIKNIVLDNKKNYCTSIQRLIESIKDKKPLDIQDKAKKISLQLQEFNENTKKSHEKTTYLIGKEVEETTNKLKEIFSLSKNTLENNKTTFKKAENLNKINSLLEKSKNLESMLKNLESEKNEKEAKFTQLKSNIQKKSKEINETKNSTEYKKLLEIKSNLSDLSEKLEKNSAEIKNSINKKLLERFIYFSGDPSEKKLAEMYLESPEKAILLDDHLKIPEFLEKTITILKQDSIKINEKKLKNLISSAVTNKEIFSRFRKERQKLHSEIEKTQEEVNEIKRKIKLKEKEREMDSLENEKSLTERDIEASIRKIKETTELIKKNRSRITEEIENQGVKII